MSNLQPPPPDYDDNPEWTEEDFARARPADEMLPPHIVALLVKTAVAQEEVTLELDRDVLEKFRGGGPGWEDRINAALRAATQVPVSDRDAA